MLWDTDSAYCRAYPGTLEVSLTRPSRRKLATTSMFPRATYTWTIPGAAVMQAESAIPVISLHWPDLMEDVTELAAIEAVGQE